MTVTQLADEYVEVMFETEPLWPAMLGLDLERPGIGDLSAEAEQTLVAKLKSLEERATAIDPASLTAEDKVTRDVLLSQLRGQLDRAEHGLVEFTVTDIFIAPAVSMLTALPMVTVATAEQAEVHLGRLAAIPCYLGQALDRHRAGIEAGRLPIAHLVRAAIDHLGRYLDSDPANDPLARQELPDEALTERRTALLRDVVRPGFAAYRDGLIADVEPHGRLADRAGLCWLPGGQESYAAFARLHTTTDRTPDELHETGLRIIGELAEEYAEIGGRVFGTRDVREVFEHLRTDPELRWRDAEDLLDTARGAIGRAEAAAPEWFGRIPSAGWVVSAVPEAEAPGAPAAYYIQPSADGARPGTYYANTHEVTERFRHAAEATAFHEAIPGHHFQISTALGLDELPLLRRLGDFNAYIEGWGLYSERLAFEMGLYSDDVALLGMLTLDSMRAGRLVVDTGLHAKGWSRQQAVDYLVEHTPMSRVEIESEVDRYLAYPGQALAYMVGRLEIQRIRAHAEKVLGDRFDIKAFHDLVLGGGALPLSTLEYVVREWAVANGAAW
ncbi:DUF885 domain-containing protein [Amycolatopsis sp. CA-230715]|uniref:DUF885 domain-containing protein n=1 Tax=Amycolatopsis sp. CA-230715 TaxID=2745196 RepID=UPI001C037CD0|nr:DUF885 domain-containing protein [Amycolatopsis sp. CA-230715]QWF76975.1 hypothetical protein HUW46_00355 [Amycolatopsis sp. CA-230715]